MARILLFIPLLINWGFNEAYVAQAQDNDKIVVQLQILVDTNNSTDYTNISSFIKRELRSIGDIDLIEAPLSETEGQISLRVMVMDLKGRRGFSISAISLISPYEEGSFWSYFKSTLFLSPPDPRRTCTDIVNWFDQSTLEAYRNALRSRQ